MNREETLSLQDGLREFVDAYMPARNLAADTKESYGRDIGQLVGFLEDRGIAAWQQVGTQDLQYFLAELERRQLRPASLHRRTHAIKTFFHFLVGAGYFDKRANPADSLIPPTVPQQDRRYLLKREYEALMAMVDEPRDRAILEVFLQAGLRLSELARLTVADIQLPEQITDKPDDVGLVKIYREKNTPAYAPLNWKACQALQIWLKARNAQVRQQGLTTPALWLSRTGSALTTRAIRNAVKKYLEEAGITDAAVHTLRHTMATHYLAKGGGLKTIQELLGHKQIKTTEIYVGLAKQVQREMVQSLAL